MYGKPIEIENNHPPIGGPAILPNESKEESKPVTLPCPVSELFGQKCRYGRTNHTIT